MEQSPSWEANQFSATQEIPCTLRNPKVHYYNQKCLPPVPILSQLDPVHTTTSHFLKIHHNITLPSMPGSPKWSPSLRFPHHNPYMPLLPPHTLYTLHAPPISFFLILSPHTILGEEYRSLSSSLCSFSPLPCYLIPLRTKYSQQPILKKQPQPTFLPQCERPSYKPIQNYSSVYLTF